MLKMIYLKNSAMTFAKLQLKIVLLAYPLFIQNFFLVNFCLPEMFVSSEEFHIIYFEMKRQNDALLCFALLIGV